MGNFERLPVRLKSGSLYFQTMTLFSIKKNYEDFVHYKLVLCNGIILTRIASKHENGTVL